MNNNFAKSVYSGATSAEVGRINDFGYTEHKILEGTAVFLALVAVPYSIYANGEVRPMSTGRDLFGSEKYEGVADATPSANYGDGIYTIPSDAENVQE